MSLVRIHFSHYNVVDFMFNLFVFSSRGFVLRTALVCYPVYVWYVFLGVLGSVDPFVRALKLHGERPSITVTHLKYIETPYS